MYKVFVNDKPIFLTTEMVYEENVRCFPLKGVDLEVVINKVAKDKWDKVYLYHPNPEKLLKKLGILFGREDAIHLLVNYQLNFPQVLGFPLKGARSLRAEAQASRNR